MKIVVNPGRTVHRAVKAGKKATFAPNGDEADARVAPEIKKHGPGSIVDVPDGEAQNLIARGAASKYDPPKAEAEVK